MIPCSYNSGELYYVTTYTKHQLLKFQKHLLCISVGPTECLSICTTRVLTKQGLSHCKGGLCNILCNGSLYYCTEGGERGLVGWSLWKPLAALRAGPQRERRQGIKSFLHFSSRADEPFTANGPL